MKFARIDKLLDKPEGKSDKGIILLPGIKGHALEDKRYRLLANELKKRGFYFLRVNIWKDEKDIGDKTLNEVCLKIDESINYIKSIGCKKIGFVGKSFGGGILLSYNSKDIKAIVLWAPAIGLNTKSNINNLKRIKFSRINNFTDIKISKDILKKINYPILVIQGTEDKIVPKENSEEIVKHLSKGFIKYVYGAGHSYENESEILQVIKTTVDFFTKNL